MKRVHPLSEKEITDLNCGYQKGSYHLFRIRCKIILLSNENKSVTQISEQLNKDKDTVYSALNKFEKDGIFGLLNKRGQGRKSVLDTLTKIQFKQLKQAVDKDPQNLSKVSALLSVEFGLEISKRMLIDFLKKNSITPTAEYVNG